MANRLVGMALAAGMRYEQLQRWRIRGPYWVPPPVVMVGRWPGWPLPMIQAWAPVVISGAGPVVLAGIDC
ncbi:hypothetical protein [Nocardia sp. NPDC059239]|uniref:hypothetical protein n=1 Tax=unclassified Nocardia TaxID=2637762 RepID=UPI0036BAF59A